MSLCFAFVVKTTLITHQSFGCCWAALAQHRGFLSPLFLISKQVGLQVGEKLGRDTARTAVSNWPKGYSRLYDVMFTDKSSRKGEMFKAMTFFFPSDHYTCWDPAFHEVATLACHWGEWMNSSFCLTGTCSFCFPHKIVIISIHGSILPSFYFLSILQEKRVSERLGVFAYWLGFNPLWVAQSLPGTSSCCSSKRNNITNLHCTKELNMVFANPMIIYWTDRLKLLSDCVTINYG